jgi:ubiquinone/menaquinone biosynthesis C-methylase UbiE
MPKRPPHHQPRARPRAERRATADKDRGWDNVAAWYDRLVGDEGSDYHRHVILPTALRMLDPKPGERLLDLCCGQGVLTRLLLDYNPSQILAVDASPRLIAAAKSRPPQNPRVEWIVRDATKLGDIADGRFDAAACIMAVQDVKNVDALFKELSRALKPGGHAVIVMMHPCFRVPRQSDWGWDDAKKTQYRRIDRYLTPLEVPIATHPGSNPGQQTFFHHHPLSAYINALGKSNLAVVAAQEPITHREPPPGPCHKGQKRSFDEIPVFLALKAIRL